MLAVDTSGSWLVPIPGGRSTMPSGVRSGFSIRWWRPADGWVTIGHTRGSGVYPLAAEANVRAIAVILFLAGLLLGVRVMFFGVHRRLDENHLRHRRWPLALAAFLVSVGGLLYARSDVTPGWLATVLLSGAVAGAAAWWL